MKLFSYSKKDYSSVGVETGRFRYDFNKAYYLFKGESLSGLQPFFSMMEIITGGYCKKSFLDKLTKFVSKNCLLDQCAMETRFSFDIPVRDPQNVICLGRNYKKHAEEFGAKVPDEPMFFAKLSSSLLPHNKPVVIPPFEKKRVDHELELAVIIGKKGRYINESDAEKHITGYTILNDVTARALQIEDMKSKKPWTRSKGYDTFGPVGPYLVPAGYIPDPHSLDIHLTVNGDMKQKSNTSNMVFKIPYLIEFISKYVTLKPGDIISTGTPEGVSEIKDGDIMEAVIEGIGTLRNRVVKDK